MERLRTFFTDADGNLKLTQRPNAPILAFVGFKIAEYVSTGPVQEITAIAATISLFIWASLELATGDSRFRQLLGLIVLVWMIVTRLM